jgi:hypothetical protein
MHNNPRKRERNGGRGRGQGRLKGHLQDEKLNTGPPRSLSFLVLSGETPKPKTSGIEGPQ